MENEESFYNYWRKHIKGHELKRYCLRILQDEVEAEKAVIRIEDRTRSAYIKLASRGETIDNFKAWVYTFTKREALRGLGYLEKEKLKILLPPPVEKGLESILDEPIDSKEGPRLLRDAWKKTVITRQEYDVIRYDLSGHFTDRKEIAEELGITRNNCDQIYMRGIRKIILAFFTHFVRYIGGPEGVRQIFYEVLENPPPFFTSTEVEAFEQVVIRRNSHYRSSGNALQSACQKMIRVPAVRENFLF